MEPKNYHEYAQEFKGMIDVINDYQSKNQLDNCLPFIYEAIAYVENIPSPEIRSSFSSPVIHLKILAAKCELTRGNVPQTGVLCYQISVRIRKHQKFKPILLLQAADVMSDLASTIAVHQLNFTDPTPFRQDAVELILRYLHSEPDIRAVDNVFVLSVQLANSGHDLAALQTLIELRKILFEQYDQIDKFASRRFRVMFSITKLTVELKNAVKAFSLLDETIDNTRKKMLFGDVTQGRLLWQLSYLRDYFWSEYAKQQALPNELHAAFHLIQETRQNIPPQHLATSSQLASQGLLISCEAGIKLAEALLACGDSVHAKNIAEVANGMVNQLVFRMGVNRGTQPVVAKNELLQRKLGATKR